MKKNIQTILFFISLMAGVFYFESPAYAAAQTSESEYAFAFPASFFPSPPTQENINSFIEDCAKKELSHVKTILNNKSPEWIKGLLNGLNDLDRHTALIASILAGKQDTARFLVELGRTFETLAFINTKTRNETALTLAIRLEQLPTIEMLLSHGANTEIPQEGLRPLARAVLTKDIRIVQALLEKGANPMAVISSGKYEDLTAAQLATQLRLHDIADMIATWGKSQAVPVPSAAAESAPLQAATPALPLLATHAEPVSPLVESFAVVNTESEVKRAGDYLSATTASPGESQREIKHEQAAISSPLATPTELKDTKQEEERAAALPFSSPKQLNPKALQNKKTYDEQRKALTTFVEALTSAVSQEKEKTDKKHIFSFIKHLKEVLDKPYITLYYFHKNLNTIIFSYGNFIRTAHRVMSPATYTIWHNGIESIYKMIGLEKKSLFYTLPT